MNKEGRKERREGGRKGGREEGRKGGGRGKGGREEKTTLFTTERIHFRETRIT